MGEKNYEAEGLQFKHLDTTKIISVAFKNQYGYNLSPNYQHLFVAKIANKFGYLRDCPVSLEGNRFLISTGDLSDLDPGTYFFEIWESYRDKDKQQLSIYPFPDSQIEFEINPNIMEKTGEIIKKLGFDDLVKATSNQVNLNLEIGTTEVLSPGSDPSVTQERQGDKTILTFHLPKGSTGQTSGGTTTIDISKYYTKKEIDAKLNDYVEKDALPDTSDFVTKGQVPEVSVSLSQRTITVNGQTLAIPDNVDLTDFAKKSEVPSVVYNAQDKSLVINGQTVVLPSNVDLSSYYNKSEIDKKLADVTTGGKIDLSDYLKIEDADKKYATKQEIPDVSGLAKKTDLDDYAKKSAVPVISLDSEARKLTLNGVTIDIPATVDLSGYATKQELPKITYDQDTKSLTINGTKIELPSNVDLSGYYTKSEVDNKLAQAATGGKVDLTGYLTKAEASKTYATKDELPSVSGLAKESDLPKITLDTEKRIITINGKSITIPDNVNLDSVKTSAYPVSEGESPSATLAKAQDGTYVISFGVPQGATGPAGHDGKNGSDGTTPHVDTATGDWFLGDKDTGVHAKGEQGKTGQTGKDGITPHIGDNGDWFLGDQDTGKPSQGKQGPQGEPGKDGQQGVPGASGKDGDTPYIGSNGNWYLGSRDTGKPSQGRAGTDGKTPIRGVDYWTDADQQAIKDEVTKIIGDAKAEAKTEMENDVLNMKY